MTLCPNENLTFPERYFLEHYNTTAIPDRPVTAVMTMLSAFGLVGTAGNSLVLCVYAKRRIKTPSTVFIIALACCDFIVCLVTVPYTMAMEYLFYEVQYDIVCKLYFFIITFNVPFSAFVMTSIAFDRYFCICHPFVNILTEYRSKIIVTLLAVFSMLLGIFTCQFYGVYQDNRTGVLKSKQMIHTLLERHVVVNTSAVVTSGCSGQMYYTGYCAANEIIFSEEVRLVYQKFYASLFLIAIFPVVILYCLIYCTVLKKRKKQVGRWKSSRIQLKLLKTLEASSFVTGDTETSCSDDKTNIGSTRVNTIKEILYLANVKTALMLFIVTLIFALAFLPAWLMACRIIPYDMVVFYMYFSYNVANPIIYAFMNDIFRQKMFDVAHCRNV